MIAALQRLIRKPSVEASPLPGKPFGADVDACFTEALTLCHELGFETTDLDRYIGWCEIGSGDEMVAVLGHLDVVPEGEGWHHRPTARRSWAANSLAVAPSTTRAGGGQPLCAEGHPGSRHPAGPPGCASSSA